MNTLDPRTEPSREQTRHLMAAILLAGNEVFKFNPVFGMTPENQKFIKDAGQPMIDTAYEIVDLMLKK